MNNYIINLDCLKITNNVNLDKFKNKSVLVLGANGLLGGYLIAVLNFANEYYQLNCKIICCSKNKPKGILKNIIGNNKEILFLKRDLTIKKNLNIFKNYKFDFIFHCATYAQPSVWMKNIQSTIILNTDVLKYFLTKAKQDKSSLMFFSSVDVYGRTEHINNSIDENFNYNDTSYKMRSAYGVSKRIGETLCKIFREKYNLSIYVVRPAHTYGPGISYLDKRAIAEFTYKAIYKKKINLLDQGKSIKTQGYISDVTEMFLNIIQYGKHMIYNTTGNDYVSISQIAKEISKNFNNVPVVYPKIKNKQKHISSDNAKVIISSERYRNEFNTKKKTNISDGIRKFVHWNLDLYKLSKRK